jgi:hypothetical protein
MKTMKFLFALCFVGLLIHPASAQVELNKTRNKSFQDALNSTLVVNTEFADINLVNHTKNSVDVNAEIRVKGKDKANAEKMLENYDVILVQEGNEIRIETKTKNLTSKGGSIEIIIDIKAPANIALNMNSGYGNVSLAEINGETNISMEYGTFSAAKLLHDSKENPVKMNIQYCEPVRIGMVKNAELNLAYSKMKMTAAGIMKAKVTYSEAEIENAVKLMIRGNYATLKLGKVSILQVDGEFSGLHLEELKKRADIEVEYGNLSITKILKSVETLEIEAEYSNIKLNGLESVSLKGETSLTELDIPAWVKVESHHGMEKTLSGGDGNTKIDLEIEHGNLKISE